MVGFCQEIAAIRLIGYKIGKSRGQSWVFSLAGHETAFEPKTGVNRNYKHVKISVSQKSLAPSKCLEFLYSHFMSSEHDSQLSGRLIPGRGHAGHSTASSPGAVPPTPLSSWPRPPRFSILRKRHSRITLINALYRSWFRSERSK